MKNCSRCLELKELSEYHKDCHKKDGRSAMCKLCTKEKSNRWRSENKDKISNSSNDPVYLSAWRKKNKGKSTEYYNRYKEKYPEKIKAHGILKYAIESGKIERGDCVICGKSNAQAHHEDYSLPLDVVWLCQSHHLKYHHGSLTEEEYNVCMVYIR